VRDLILESLPGDVSVRRYVRPGVLQLHVSSHPDFVNSTSAASRLRQLHVSSHPDFVNST